MWSVKITSASFALCAAASEPASERACVPSSDLGHRPSPLREDVEPLSLREREDRRARCPTAMTDTLKSDHSHSHFESDARARSSGRRTLDGCGGEVR